MADKAISELISAAQITSTDNFVLEQNGTAKKLTGQVLLNWLTAAADGHGGISSIEKKSTSGLTDTYRITLADTTTFDFKVTNGKSISSFSKQSTSGLKDTWRMRYNDGTYTDIVVTNGEKGDKGDNATVYIKWASQEPTASSHSIGDVPDNWMGVYAGYAASAPTDWTQYKWYEIKGKKGDTGNPSQITSQKVEYQASDSGSIIPSGNWSTTIPVVSQGRYLWTRITMQWNSGSPQVSYSVGRMGMDGSGSVSMVNNVSPDTSGNVTLTASDVEALPISGGAMTGGINMQGQPIEGLNDPVNESDAAPMRYVDTQTKAVSDKLGTYVRPNLLDNWYFGNPVNQRGNLTTTQTGYFIDRWLIDASAGINVSLQDGAIRLKQTGGSASWQSMLQKIDNPIFLSNMPITVSAVCKGTGRTQILILANEAELAKKEFGPSDTYTIASLSATLPANLQSLSIFFYSDVSGNLGYTDFLAAKAEVGTTQTLANTNNGLFLNEIPDYGEQLARCQRYFRRDTFYWKDFASGSAFEANVVHVPIRLGASMRTGDFSVSISNLNDIAIVSQSVLSQVPSGFDKISMNDHMVMLKFTVPTALPLRQSVTAYGANGVNIDYIADL